MTDLNYLRTFGPFKVIEFKLNNIDIFNSLMITKCHKDDSIILCLKRKYHPDFFDAVLMILSQKLLPKINTLVFRKDNFICYDDSEAKHNYKLLIKNTLMECIDECCICYEVQQHETLSHNMCLTCVANMCTNCYSKINKCPICRTAF